VLGGLPPYAGSASKVSPGELAGQLNPKGRDELHPLGSALDDTVDRTRHDRHYGQTQQEFTDSMQLAENEQEVHSLLKRHLERSIPGSSVTVFNRNNSADRLQAMTEVPEGSPHRFPEPARVRARPSASPACTRRAAGRTLCCNARSAV